MAGPPTGHANLRSFKQKQCVLTLTDLVSCTRTYLSYVHSHSRMRSIWRIRKRFTGVYRVQIHFILFIAITKATHGKNTCCVHFLRSPFVPSSFLSSSCGLSVLCLFYTSACCTFLYQCTEVASHRDCDWDSLNSHKLIRSRDNQHRPALLRLCQTYKVSPTHIQVIGIKHH